MQHASSVLQNLLQDEHAHLEQPKENLKKIKVFSLRPQSSGGPWLCSFCSDLMLYACKTHLRLSGICRKMSMQILKNLRKT